MNCIMQDGWTMFDCPFQREFQIEKKKKNPDREQFVFSKSVYAIVSAIVS